MHPSFFEFPHLAAEDHPRINWSRSMLGFTDGGTYAWDVIGVVDRLQIDSCQVANGALYLEQKWLEVTPDQFMSNTGGLQVSEVTDWRQPRA